MDFKHANQKAYFTLAPYLENSVYDVINLEDAAKYNDLALFDYFKTKKLQIGLLAVCQKEIESKEQILKRLEEISKKIPKERLIVSPDCGLGMLCEQVAEAKLLNLKKAVVEFNLK